LDPFDWSIQMLEERGLLASYFMTTTYISDGSVVLDSNPLRTSWRAAFDQGNEIGHHTQYHLDGQPPNPEDPPFRSDDWAIELDTGFHWLTAPFESEDAGVELGLGIPRSEIFGFRSPFLHYNDALFPELRERGIWYDCSIEEGWQLDQDASQFAWPYTLDEGSNAHDYAQERGFESKNFDLTSHPGVIELPAYALVIPPEGVADDYDIEPGLLDKVRSYIPEREPGSDRITGLDYNLWWEAHLTKEEVLAILKYNLDQRLSGNRAPLLFGVHTDFYRENWGSDETFERRREAIEEFLDYARSLQDVRIVTFKEVADFMREPRPIECYVSESGAGGAGGGSP
jgi:peptidoglycan/xylan/chitin deacetylase (PgdA/CDA1 family)